MRQGTFVLIESCFIVAAQVTLFYLHCFSDFPGTSLWMHILFITCECEREAVDLMITAEKIRLPIRVVEITWMLSGSGVSGMSPPLFLKDHEVSKNSVSALPQNQIKSKWWWCGGPAACTQVPATCVSVRVWLKKQTFLYVISTWEGMWLGNRPGP